ncbi:hypothetical protein RRG08_007011, partial [Elysia crispata]
LADRMCGSGTPRIPRWTCGFCTRNHHLHPGPKEKRGFHWSSSDWPDCSGECSPM